jgi:8-oxo-dGTP pyrophosphatase MutT (NUDIX family)|tara:strand:+ start:648 stop:1139 length:492 start_codon:yes stop_codon:yes gene_type:complete
MNIPSNFRKRIAVWIKKDKLFIVGKMYNKQTKKYYYTEPGGGIEDNQTYKQAAINECLEEIGILIKNIKLINIDSYKVDWYKLQSQGIKLSDKQKKRMKKYRGNDIIACVAEFKEYDNSIIGGDDDIYMKPEYVTKQKLIQNYKKNYFDKNLIAWKIKVLELI